MAEKIDYEDQSTGEPRTRPLEAGGETELHEAAEAARDALGPDCLAVGLCVVRASPEGVGTAMYVTYVRRLEAVGTHLRDLIGDTVAAWDRAQRRDRD